MIESSVVKRIKTLVTSSDERFAYIFSNKFTSKVFMRFTADIYTLVLEVCGPRYFRNPTRPGPTLVNVFKTQPNPTRPNFENSNPTQHFLMQTRTDPTQPGISILIKKRIKIIRFNVYFDIRIFFYLSMSLIH